MRLPFLEIVLTALGTNESTKTTRAPSTAIDNDRFASTIHGPTLDMCSMGEGCVNGSSEACRKRGFHADAIKA